MKKSFFVLILSSLLLSSCIKIDVEQTTNLSGKSSISMEVDMSAYIEQLQALAASQSGATNTNMQDIDYCENAEEHPLFDTQNCYQKDENIFGMNGTIDLIKNGWMKVGENSAYTLDVRAMVPKILSSDEETFEENYDASGENSPQSLGFQYTYTLELPAITNMISIDGEEIEVRNGNADFDFGKIEDNVLIFDIFEMLDAETFVVSGGESLANGVSSMEYSYVFQRLTPQQQKNVLSALQKIQDTSKILKLETQVTKNIATLNMKKSLTQKEKQRLEILSDLSELIKIRLNK